MFMEYAQKISLRQVTNQVKQALQFLIRNIKNQVKN